MIKDSEIIYRRPDIIHNKLDDEIVMMSISQGEYYGLNEIGSRIWEIIEEHVTFKQIIDKLLGEFEVNEEKCRREVTEFIGLLQKKNLVIIE